MDANEFHCSGSDHVIEGRRWWAPKRMWTIIAFAGLGLAGCATRLPPGLAAVASPSPAECIPVEPGAGCLPVAPSSARVDLTRPSFSDPTRVDNPLHPSGLVRSAVYLGMSGGEPFRSEVTLLPTTRTIEWSGQRVEVLESQYVAYVDGRLHEVAIDWYAQADDGSVWYFGEDVFNYEGGRLADTHGTWLAGRDGPAAMIMPAHPEEGNVYRPENIPGVVFEEVIVLSAQATVDGPTGTVPGALMVRELHMDGSTEEKIFAPGYGEFSTGSGNDLEALAVAVPTDRSSEPMPKDLAALSAALDASVEAVARGDWPAAEVSLTEASTAWDRLRITELPPGLAAGIDDGWPALFEAAGAHDSARFEEAVFATARAVLDVYLLYRPVEEVDQLRFEWMVRRLAADAESGAASLVAGSATALEWIGDRFLHVLGDSDRATIESLLEELRSASAAENVAAAAEVTARLDQAMARLRLAGG